MADKGQGDSLQGTPSPPPCANGCGFFGSASTMNMCSKCFRECQKTSPPATSPTPASPSLEQPTTSPPSTSPASIPTPTFASVPPPQSPAAPVFTPSAVTSTPVEEDPAAPPPRKVQKNTSRCFSCRKKIGLTGFKCHCGYFYCATHRYSDAHECDFDYQTSGRQQLAKANPVVIASKLDKI